MEYKITHEDLLKIQQTIDEVPLKHARPLLAILQQSLRPVEPEQIKEVAQETLSNGIHAEA